MNPLFSLATQQEALRYRRSTSTTLQGFPPTGDGPAVAGMSFWLKGDSGLDTDQQGGLIRHWADSAGLTGGWTQSTSTIRFQWDRFTGTASLDARAVTAPYVNAPNAGLPISRRAFSAVYVCSLNVVQRGLNRFLNKTTSDTFNLAIDATTNRLRVINSGGVTSSTMLPLTSDLCAIGFSAGPSEFRFFLNDRTERAAALTPGFSNLLSVGGGLSAAPVAASLRDVIYFDRGITEDEWFRVILPYARSRGVRTESTWAFCAVGDSITQGFGATALSQAWANKLKVGPNCRRANLGIGGQTIANIVGLGTSHDAMKGAKGDNVMTVWAGTNDLAVNNSPEATVYNNIVTYCTARRAAGWKVVVMTIIPRSTITGANETSRLGINSSILTNWSTFADAVVDVASLAEFSNTSDTTYFIDGTHPTELGYEVLRQSIEPAVLGLVTGS